MDNFEMEMNGDETHSNGRCNCNYPCSDCPSSRFSFSWNDSNLFYALKRFINVTFSNRKRIKRIHFKKELSDCCGLILQTLKLFYMSYCHKMKARLQQTKSNYFITNSSSSKSTNLFNTFLVVLLLSHQIRQVLFNIIPLHKSVLLVHLQKFDGKIKILGAYIIYIVHFFLIKQILNCCRKLNMVKINIKNFYKRC